MIYKDFAIIWCIRFNDKKYNTIQISLTLNHEEQENSHWAIKSQQLRLAYSQKMYSLIDSNYHTLILMKKLKDDTQQRSRALEPFTKGHSLHSVSK